MSNRTIGMLALIVVILVALLFVITLSREPVEDVKVIYVTVTPAPTEVIIQDPTVVPTPTPIYIQVTPEPTVEPEIVYVTPEPTAVITQEPTVVPTPTPIYIQVTPEPSMTPEIIYVTPEPTEVVTQTPTVMPTPTPTPIYVEVTAEPTKQPEIVYVTPEPTVAAAPTQDMSVLYTKLEEEISTLVSGSGIYPDYCITPQNDLYNYIAVDGIDSNMLFSLLRKPFENAIANWTPMEFVQDCSSLNRLAFALESTICDSCGRVMISNHPENQSAITTTFVEIIQRGECKEANQILLKYLNQYTVKNQSNPYERLFVACND